MLCGKCAAVADEGVPDWRRKWQGNTPDERTKTVGHLPACDGRFSGNVAGYIGGYLLEIPRTVRRT